VPDPVSVGEREIALRNEILRCEVGSSAHGMALPGTSDRDEMGVYVEMPGQLLGIQHTSEHYVSRTQPEGVRSGPGDLDLTLYSLRKYMRLATAGNPTVLVLLYANPISTTPLGEELRALAPKIVSVRAARKFLGYLDGQRERMLGGGKQSHVPKRPELIERHGYDTKYASHAVRLGLQGIELMIHGRLRLPMPERALETAMSVKQRQMSFEQVLGHVDSLRARLAERLASGEHTLREEPDMDLLNAWLTHAHLRHWGVEGL